MAITQTKVTGRISFADDTNPSSGVVEFTLSGFDTFATTDAVVIGAARSAMISPSTGEIDIDLFPNGDGGYGTHYVVRAIVYTDGTSTTHNLGFVTVPQSGPVDLNDILQVNTPAEPTTSEYAALLSSSVAAAEASALAAAAAVQTGTVIKAAYEAEADTNAFTDSEKAELAAISVNYLSRMSSGDLTLADSSAIVEGGLSADAATNTAEINTLLGDLPSSGGRLTLTPGSYAVNGLATISNKDITVVGAGRRTTNLVMSGSSGNLFTVSQNSQGLRARFEKFSALKASDASTTGVALRFDYPSVSSSLSNTVHVSDFECRGDGTQFAAGVLVNNAWNTTFRGIEFEGVTNTTTATGAVVYQGKCTVSDAEDIKVMWANAGLHVEGGSFGEGYRISNMHCVATNWMVRAQDGQDAPGLYVSNSHGETFQGGVYSLNRNQIFLDGLHLYKRVASTSNWTGVWLEANGAYNADLFNFRGLTILGFKDTAAGGTAVGMLIDDSDVTIGTGTTIMDCDVGINLNSNSNAVVDFIYNNVTTPTQNVPAGATVTATSVAS